MYFVGKITRCRSLHLSKVWMETRGWMLCLAFFSLLVGSVPGYVSCFRVACLNCFPGCLCSAGETWCQLIDGRSDWGEDLCPISVLTNG